MSTGVYTKFLANLTRIFAADLHAFPACITVALSGGADSMALLNMLVRLKEEKLQNLHIHAITVNHNVRPESAEEAQEVGEVVSKLPVEHHILDINQKIGPKQMEKNARELRYKLLLGACEKVGAGDIFMGHHRSDQLETFLLRMLNNSTLFGLRSMKPVSNYPIVSPNLDLKVVRPMLNIDKSEILSYCKSAGLKWFEDRTNFIPGLTKRNYFRSLLKDDKNKLPPALQKSKILDSLAKVESFNKIVDLRMNNIRKRLQEEGADVIDPKTMSLKLFFPADMIGPLNYVALDRYLFLDMYQVSASANYFHEFTKVDDKYSTFIPKVTGRKDKSSLIEDIWNGKKPSRFTLLKCQFDVKRSDDGIEMEISRANEDPRRGFHVLPFDIKSGEPTQWLFFDERLFLKFSCIDPNMSGRYRLEIFKDKVHLDILKKSFARYSGFKKLLNKYHVPVLIRSGESGDSDKIVGFPTLWKYADDVKPGSIVCEMKMKRALL